MPESSQHKRIVLSDSPPKSSISEELHAVDAEPTTPPPWVPEDQACQTTYNYAKVHLHRDVFNHSLRVYHYAAALRDKNMETISQLQPTDGKPSFDKHDIFRVKEDPPGKTLLFVSAMFHDIGTSAYHDKDQRFEVCGADAAVNTLDSFEQFTGTELKDVWTAIALHSSPGIAERMDPMTRLLRIAVKADFGTQEWRDMLGDQAVRDTEAMLPRGEIEKVLADSVVEQAKRREGEARLAKAPKATWPGNLLRVRLEDPSWEGVNPGF